MKLEFDLVTDLPIPDNVDEMFNGIVDFIVEHQEVLSKEETVDEFIVFCDDNNYPMPLAQQMAYHVLVALCDEKTLDKMLNFDIDPSNTIH